MRRSPVSCLRVRARPTWCRTAAIRDATGRTARCLREELRRAWARSGTCPLPRHRPLRYRVARVRSRTLTRAGAAVGERATSGSRPQPSPGIWARMSSGSDGGALRSTWQPGPDLLPQLPRDPHERLRPTCTRALLGFCGTGGTPPHSGQPRGGRGVVDARGAGRSPA